MRGLLDHFDDALQVGVVVFELAASDAQEHQDGVCGLSWRALESTSHTWWRGCWGSWLRPTRQRDDVDVACDVGEGVDVADEQVRVVRVGVAVGERCGGCVVGEGPP